MNYKITSAPDVEPLTVADVKLHLRMTSDTTEDALISALITAAREYCERYTERAFMTQTVALYLDEWPDEDYIELPLAPLQSVTSVVYKNSAGTETTMTVTTDYIVDANSPTGRVVLAYGKTWPDFTAYPVNPITITYKAGYTAVPKSLRQAMLLLIGNWYENRESTVIGTVTKEMEFAVKALLDQYRFRWWG